MATNVKITRLRWVYLILALVITWERVCGRPSILVSAWAAEEEGSDDHNDAVEELKKRILEDLGFHQVPTNLSTISTQEYLRAYREYMTNVQKRRQAQRPMWKNARERRNHAPVKLHTLFPEQVQETSEHMWTLSFPLSHLQGGRLEIRQATLWLAEGCRRENETGMGMEGGEERVDVTTLIRRWKRQQRKGKAERDWNFSSYCPRVEEEQMRFLRLEVLCKNRGGRLRRELRKNKKRLRVSDFEEGGEELEMREKRLGKRRAKDCATDQMRGRSCCRKSLQVSLEELKISEVILAPASFDMNYCEGRCSARRLPYASNHAIFQHMILKVGKGTKLCCTPTKLSEIDVIQRDPVREDQLKVTVIHNAKVEECGCS